MKYLIDSNIIIYHLNGEKIATDFILSHIHVSAISQITYIEGLSFDFDDENEFAEVKELLESFEIIDTSKAIAVQCIKNRKKRKIKLPDNLIASTAQINDLILVTRNTADFKNLDLKIMNIFEQKDT